MIPVRFSPFGHWPALFLLALCAFLGPNPGAVAQVGQPSVRIDPPSTFASMVQELAQFGPYTFTAGGGTGVYTWSATGLPAGIAMSAGVLQGSPAAGSHGSYNVKISVVDTAGTSGQLSFTITVVSVLVSITGPSGLSAGTEARTALSSPAA